MIKVADFQALIEALSHWLDFILHPVRNVNALLENTSTTKDYVSIMTTWAPSLLLTVLINVVITSYFGIPYSNLGYHLPFLVITLLFQLVLPIIMDLGFRLGGIASDRHGVTVLFTPVIIYSPIASFISVPLSVNSYAFAQSVKHLSIEKGLSPLVAFANLFPTYTKENGSLQPFGLYSWSMCLGSCVYLLTLALFAEFCSQLYQAPRFRTYLLTNGVMFLVLLMTFLIQAPLLAWKIHGGWRA